MGVTALVPLMGLVGLICLALNPSSAAGHVYLNLFLLEVIGIPSIIIHEFAHALVGKAAGLSVPRIWIGRGKTFFRKSIVGFDTEFKVLPFGGFAFLRPKANSNLRVRFFVSVLAGPLANVGILALTLRYLSWKNVNFEESIQFFPIIFASQAFILIENLLPYKVQTGLGTFRTDGLFLLHLLFKRTVDFAGAGATSG